MKTPIIALALFAFCSFAGDLTTRTGQTYRNVELVSHDVFSAKLKHSAGFAVIRYVEMTNADKMLQRN